MFFFSDACVSISVILTDMGGGGGGGRGMAFWQRAPL
jgi:hypothetical protein